MATQTPVGPTTQADPQMEQLMQMLASLFKGTGFDITGKNTVSMLARLLMGQSIPGLSDAIGFQTDLEPQRQQSILSLLGGDQAMLDKIRTASEGNASRAAEHARATGNQSSPYDFLLQSLMDTNAATRDYVASGPSRRLGVIDQASQNPFMNTFGQLSNIGQGIQSTPDQGSALGGILGSVAGGLDWTKILGL